MENNKYTYLNLAKDVLKEIKTPMTPKEIWAAAKTMGLTQKLNSEGKTPIQTMGARLYTDAGSHFERVGENPTRFILKGSDTNIDNQIFKMAPELIFLNEEKNGNKCEERKLHPLVVKFINSELLAYSKTIFHENSNRNSENKKWLHPDIVAVTYKFANLREHKTNELSDLLSIFPAKLYSFELKLKLKANTLDFKKDFFQAVSNSSWANQGFLVAPEISKEPEDLMEMERLTSLHGIGIIELNKKVPEKSTILYPARENETLDLLTIDKLIRANIHFKDFITEVLTSAREKRICNENFYDSLD